MNFDNAAAIAEIVGSIVIVLTLLYLAKQTRQTNIALLANSRQTTMVADVNFLLDLMDHPEVKWLRNERDAKEFSADRIAAARATAAFLRIREFAWFQYQSGILDDAAWKSVMAPTARVLGSAAGIDTWKQYRDEMDPGFVEWCERLISLNEPSP